MAPIGLALIGGGIFIQEAHLPAILSLPPSTVHIVALYSRTLASATAAVEECSNFGLGTPAVYADDTPNDLSALLKREDVQAVIVAVPIPNTGEVVMRCLEAGKHVLSEKPVGKDVAEGIELIKKYETLYKPKGLIWRVAENWEVEPTFRFIKSSISAGKIGAIQTFSLTSISYMPPSNKWLGTPWRAKPTYQGGFLLDGGVHQAAFLRTVLPSPTVSLCGYATLQNEHLAPHDCIHAALKCADGAQGFFSLNAGASGWEGRGGGTMILGKEGSVEVQFFEKEGKQWIRAVLRAGKKGEQKEETFESPSCGVAEEQKFFFEAANGKKENDFGNPRGTLEDVALIQAALTSEGNKIEFSQLIPKF
ncbi:NADP-binding protein [Dacryopinax primogenitus]|uniref:NADP-binding protein n=1 Tax=Dacryopinax primogenitus (strain DJM 731) TaxID=1858805 RepID=M5FZQ1_DACPD|nr:NADP-binding protein [Dacryopinax primogenitus]EJU01365.1 NADP-binding protein [Dacryopinax primogenitus]